MEEIDPRRAGRRLRLSLRHLAGRVVRAFDEPGLRHRMGEAARARAVAANRGFSG